MAQLAIHNVHQRPTSMTERAHQAQRPTSLTTGSHQAQRPTLLTAGSHVPCVHNFNWILDDLAVGNINIGSDLSTLKRNGIDVIVCAIPQLPHPASVYSSNGFSLFHIPIDDSPDVDIKRWFSDVSHFILVHRFMGRKTLVHCHAGMSRSVSLACAYLMNLLNCDAVKALYWIQQKRPCIAVNPGFYRQLITYGQELQHKK